MNDPRLPGVVEAAVAVDPVTVELVRGAMRSIQGEMEALIERTAMSAFIREKKDFYAGLFDARGRFIAGKSRPGSSDLIGPILEQYPADTVKAGDLYWYNDCYAARGAVSHSPDQVLAAPVFHDGRLVAWAQAWAHFSDIGGMHAGSISPACTEIFQEGIIVPPVRLAAEGRMNDELLRLFLRNSRFPEAVGGDMRALIAAVRLGEKRLAQLVARFGATRTEAVFDDLIRRVREVLQQRFRALVPDGTYRFTDTVDSDGHGSGPIRLRWTLEVTPGRITLDATGSDDQVRGPVNYMMSMTEPGMTFGSFLLGDSREYTLNAGAEALFDELKVRPGSILQPKFPAPLGQRSITKMRNLGAYLGLLGVATGGRMPAAHSGYVIWTVRGLDNAGARFLMSDGVAVGYGARATADGHDAIYLVAQENYPAEFVEASYPLRVRHYGLNRDTGGPGRWRGGCGVVREMEILCDEVTVAVRIEGDANPPWGVNGGRCAGSGRCVVNPGRADERVLPPLSDSHVLHRGDVVRIETGGGGGWGHPYDREPERVLADVLGGHVSARSAADDYGVVLAGDGRSIDAVATGRRRAERPATALFHRHTYRDALE
ncbi:MAG: hydantoinase B/oxoprolinase family protein [bacterium]|jgi:N-methylhydantoinase B|nr:hydantoinase B/oxoprolinase family protein [Betaproteobacteria bacterium]